ncbi:hypothetical protein CV_1732 [Chromobacterium violaceum ATCC 12472]|uniref:Uncharacterized protein n=1 Tax=Chromobacterium violaceum (strain ATCC 12472 / DSM 30191 / JCM 1249 / CCUG 213 / NBRC 12614 / NCIMB 9131 / NCTC 9757 / MK) TaxID=243365 RepID=Q7NX95_CHRVO|nr:hypothetical protein CV_1732 [Chromobacterium violaceum ATCC 12472]
MITGPKHNLLQVRVTQETQGSPVCETLPSNCICKHKPLDKKNITQRVIEGAAEANRRMGTNYSITHIRYVASDTGPEVVYGYLCLKLLEHLEHSKKFQPSGNTTK